MNLDNYDLLEDKLMSSDYYDIFCDQFEECFHDYLKYPLFNSNNRYIALGNICFGSPEPNDENSQQIIYWKFENLIYCVNGLSNVSSFVEFYVLNDLSSEESFFLWEKFLNAIENKLPKPTNLIIESSTNIDEGCRVLPKVNFYIPEIQRKKVKLVFDEMTIDVLAYTYNDEIIIKNVWNIPAGTLIKMN